jgi:thiosulfate dehydrogenase [quinone] large subunit
VPLSEQFSIKLPGWPVALLRICLGILFFRAIPGKFAAGSHWPDVMVSFLNQQKEQAFAFYWPFIEKVIIPHNVIFADLAKWGELGIGLGLITGTATRLIGFLGVIMILNYMWAKGQPFWLPTSHDTLFVLILLTLSTVGAGRVLGIDYFLAKKYPRCWLW